MSKIFDILYEISEPHAYNEIVEFIAYAKKKARTYFKLFGTMFINTNCEDFFLRLSSNLHWVFVCIKI